MKKIIMSLAMIAAVSALVIGATGAFFSDTETSNNNTFSMGEIDISVDGENPWTKNWHNYLDKPSQTNYMNFTIKNEGTNPARVWKRITGVENSGGDDSFCGASSEPEYVDGGGQFTNNVCNSTGYVERDNLSAFMVYDMAICRTMAEDTSTDCPMTISHTEGNVTYYKPAGGGNWVTVVSETDQVRVDNVVNTWVKLVDELAVGEKMVVSQSYHLMTWTDSGQPMITNWAQGDVMTFDIELDARQLDAPAPGTTEQDGKVYATANLSQKNTTTWVPYGATGSLTYEVAAAAFNYDFNGTVPVEGEYQLIYYPDPWASNKQIVRIGSPVASTGLNITLSGTPDLGMDLPNSATDFDSNYPVGAKVWLVPTSDLSGNTLSWTNPDQYLFDVNMVNYDDTGV